MAKKTYLFQELYIETTRNPTATGGGLGFRVQGLERCFSFCFADVRAILDVWAQGFSGCEVSLWV